MPGLTDHPISSRRRYDRFGTSPGPCKSSENRSSPLTSIWVCGDRIHDAKFDAIMIRGFAHAVVSVSAVLAAVSDSMVAAA